MTTLMGNGRKRELHMDRTQAIAWGWARRESVNLFVTDGCLTTFGEMLGI